MRTSPSTAAAFHDADQAADAVVRLVRERGPHAGATTVVAVDGRSGAGKTQLADFLVTRLDDAVVLRLDDVYPGWDGLDAGVQRLVDGVLEPLAHGRAAVLHRYDWAADKDGAMIPVPDRAVLVVEGCGAGARACAPFLSALVWVQAPTAVRFQRAVARDGERYRPHWPQWARQEDTHFVREGTCERADLWLHTHTPVPPD